MTECTTESEVKSNDNKLGFHVYMDLFGFGANRGWLGTLLRTSVSNEPLMWQLKAKAVLTRALSLSLSLSLSMDEKCVCD